MTAPRQQLGQKLKLAGHAVEFGPWAEVVNAGSGTIEQLDDALHRAAREYLTSPPGALLHRVGQTSRQVPGLLQEHRRLRHARDLYQVLRVPGLGGR